MRLQAAEWFAEGVTPPEVARRLRVSSNSAYVWRRRWRAGGAAALASRGPGGAVCRLGGAQLARLRAALDGGPAMWGWGEGVWANMKNGLGNLAARDVDQLAAIIKNRLKRIQYRPALIDGFLAQTGLTLEPGPP